MGIGYLLYKLFHTTSLEKYIQRKNIKTLDIQDEMKNMKTGDLLFFSGLSTIDDVIKRYTSSYISHVGMIILENNVLYLFEADNGQGYKRGVRVIPLKEKLERYKGEKFYILRKIDVEISKDEILNEIKRYIDMDLNVDNFLTKSNTEGGKTTYCSQLIIDVLRDMKIYKNDVKNTSVTPKDLLHIDGYEDSVYLK